MPQDGPPRCKSSDRRIKPMTTEVEFEEERKDPDEEIQIDNPDEEEEDDQDDEEDK
jgi:hypothetical protein